jgi:hypothetical protein
VDVTITAISINATTVIESLTAQLVPEAVVCVLKVLIRHASKNASD